MTDEHVIKQCDEPVIESALPVSPAPLPSVSLAEEREDDVAPPVEEAVGTEDVTPLSDHSATQSQSEGNTISDAGEEEDVECVSSASAVEEEATAVDEVVAPLHDTKEETEPMLQNDEASLTSTDTTERCTTPDSLAEPLGLGGDSDDGFSSSSNSAATVSDDHSSFLTRQKDGEASAPYTPRKSAAFQHTIPYTPTTYTPTGKTLEEILRAADQAMAGDSEAHEFMTMLDDTYDPVA